MDSSRSPGASWVIVLFVLIGLAVLGGCSLPPVVEDQSARATADALATENARLLVALATAEAAEQAVTPVPASETPPSETPAPPVPAQAPAQQPMPENVSLLPKLLARVVLGTDGALLRDVRVDRAANRIYATDSAKNLHVVDATSFALLQTVPAAGELLSLDAANQRLYISPAYGNSEGGKLPTIRVYDTANETLLSQTIEGGRISVDSERNRLYVGEPFILYPETPARGVRLIDGASLEVLAESAQSGIPVYNPLADELLISAYTAYSADPSTLAVRDDLVPELAQQTIPGCNGCDAVEGIYVFPEKNVIVIDMTTLSAGKGPGFYPPPLLLDATTLDPVADSLQFDQPLCGSQPVLRGPINHLSYVTEQYSRYVVYNNLSVYDTASGASDALVTWRDGLPAPFFNPHTGVAYQQGYGRNGLLVLDLATLTPIGSMPPVCITGADADAGRVIGFWESDLLVLSETDGESVILPPEAMLLAGSDIQKIFVSPAFAEDQTIFLIANAYADDGESRGQIILRSSDAGKTWLLLQGGLPYADDTRWALALSPAFGVDHTLFAAGVHGEYAGDGVWRSQDGGDTWRPLWDNLTHLRVEQLVLSPRFAEDGALLAYGRYARLTPWESGASIQRSDDFGLSWTMVMTAPYADLLPAPETLLNAAPSLQLPVRKTSYSAPIEFTLDGATWQTATGNLAANEVNVLIGAAPRGLDTSTIYAVTNRQVLRTLDSGVTWQRWDNPLLAGRTYTNELSAAAVTPALIDGNHLVLVGTRRGEFWSLDPLQMIWQEVTGSPDTGKDEATPTPAATPALVATAVAPPTPVPPLSGEPPVGLFRPRGLFGGQWQGEPALQQALGWSASEQHQLVEAAVQTFEHGVMIWRGDTRQIYAIFNDNTWGVFDDSFAEGDMESDPSLVAPGGLQQPVRGFGKVWRNTPDVRAKLGWATAKEKADSASLQEFERGAMIYLAGQVFALSDGPQGRVWK